MGSKSARCRIATAAAVTLLAATACTADEDPAPQAQTPSAGSASASPSQPTGPAPSTSPGHDNGGNGGKGGEPRTVSVPGGVTLTELPERAVTICAKGPPLSRACPRLIPLVEDVSIVIDTFGRPGGRFQVLEMAAGAPSSNDPSLSRPPGVAHIVIEVGKRGFLVDLGEPVPVSETLATLIESERSGSQLVRPEPSWGWDEPLILAEPFPGGGAHGDHLIYRWSKGDFEYRVSLHTWAPAGEVVRTLHAMVKSIR